MSRKWERHSKKTTILGVTVLISTESIGIFCRFAEDFMHVGTDVENE